MTRFFQTSHTTKDQLLDNTAQAEALEEVVNISKEELQGAALSVNAKTNTLLKAGPVDLKLKTTENYVTQAINRIDTDIVTQTDKITNHGEFMANTIGNVSGDQEVAAKFESLGQSLIENAYDMKNTVDGLVNAVMVRDNVILDSNSRFPLTQTPIINAVHDIRLFINTIEYRKGVHFTVALHPISRKYQLTWTFTEDAGGFNIEEDFSVTLEYFTAPTTTE